MAAPEDNGAGGMLNGHGVGVAMVAIFAGMALVVAFAASDGAIFGMNFSSASDNNAPVVDGNTGGAGVLSRDMFDEASGGAPTQPDAGSNVSSTLTEEERRLLAMRNFSWDSIAGRYITSSQDTMDKFDQQNFTREEPAQPEAEPLLWEEIFVDVDRNRDRDSGDDEQSTNTQDDQEEEPQDGAGQQDGDATGGGESGGNDQSGESGSEGDSGSNSTGTNSTSTQGSSEGSGSGDGGNDTSSDNSSIEASVSLG